jgi:hypothetical protein
MCSLFLYFSARSSAKTTKYERLLQKGTSFAKADDVCTAFYKRRKYMYVEQMLFLIHQTQDRATSSNSSPMTVSNGEEHTDERWGDEEGSNDGTAETYTCQKKQQKEYLAKDKLCAAVAGHPEGEE